MIRNLTYTLTSKDASFTIEQYLRSLGYSHHVLTLLKRTPLGIYKNQERAYSNQKIAAGDVISIHLEEMESSPNIVPAQVPFNIVYEDEDLLVINKPCDTPVHPSQGNSCNTLANGVAAYFSARNIPYVFRCVNRLDRDTTGLLILAKHAISSGILSSQMENRQIKRTYHALVYGHTPPLETIDLPIGRKDGSIIERCVDPLHGDQAVTHYRTLDQGVFSDSGIPWSRLELWLETGRTHQIRVHMKNTGHPLFGDTLYYPEDASGYQHQLLHSYSIAFTHPITGKSMEFHLPEAWNPSGM
ncbi:MAG: RluA family pseudouridine synthase [Lachnospiraceae bacterium]|nr:RluA family pseudouridine synthase [Lachnospiraceae bacterium]